MAKCAQTPTQASGTMKGRGPVVSVAQRLGDPGPLVFVSEEFKLHEGPLKAGDLIVIECNGKIFPKRPDNPRPQVFRVANDQKDGESIGLLPVEAPKNSQPTRYIVAWFE